MKERHFLVAKWAADHAAAKEQFRAGKGPPVWGFNNQDYRRLRILSSLFYAVENLGVRTGSHGYPEFHFRYYGGVVVGSLDPIDRVSHNDKARLRS